jgi:hypothetical protein
MQPERCFTILVADGGGASRKPRAEAEGGNHWGLKVIAP